MLLMIDNYDYVLLRANNITGTQKISAESIVSILLPSISGH